MNSTLARCLRSVVANSGGYFYAAGTTKWSSLLGRTIEEVRGEQGGEELRFIFADGDELLLHHQQECCEDVRLEEVVGDLNDLVGSPLLQAEEVAEEEPEAPEDRDYGYIDSYTWTFYKFATIKGTVTLRWFGESNGYYSEEVDAVLIVEG